MGRLLNDELYVNNVAGLYVKVEPISAALVAAASTGQVVAKKSDGTLELVTPSGGGAIAIQTAVASASDAHTTDNTWEDVKNQALSGALQVTITASAAGILLCHLTIEVSSTSGGNWDHKGFRFVLDGATNSETWSEFRNNAPSDTSQVWLLSMHTVFSGVSAGSHTVKAQCWDRGSNQNLTFTERRLTVLAP